MFIIHLEVGDEERERFTPFNLVVEFGHMIDKQHVREKSIREKTEKKAQTHKKHAQVLTNIQNTKKTIKWGSYSFLCPNSKGTQIQQSNGGPWRGCP